VKDALEQFENALELNPTPIEAQAALYNKACCHAYRWGHFPEVTGLGFALCMHHAYL